MRNYYILMGVILAYSFHRLMIYFDKYRVLKDGFDKSLGRIKISVKYNKKKGSGQR
jgi:hypothetical protein